MIQTYKHHDKIKAFVRAYRDRASPLLTLAVRANAGDRGAYLQLLREAVSAKEVREALDLARALGPSVGPIVHEIITAYYGGRTIDAFA